MIEVTKALKERVLSGANGEDTVNGVTVEKSKHGRAFGHLFKKDTAAESHKYSAEKKLISKLAFPQYEAYPANPPNPDSPVTSIFPPGLEGKMPILPNGNFTKLDLDRGSKKAFDFATENSEVVINGKKHKLYILVQSSSPQFNKNEPDEFLRGRMNGQVTREEGNPNKKIITDETRAYMNMNVMCPLSDQGAQAELEVKYCDAFFVDPKNLDALQLDWEEVFVYAVIAVNTAEIQTKLQDGDLQSSSGELFKVLIDYDEDNDVFLFANMTLCHKGEFGTGSLTFEFGVYIIIICCYMWIIVLILFGVSPCNAQTDAAYMKYKSADKRHLAVASSCQWTFRLLRCQNSMGNNDHREMYGTRIERDGTVSINESKGLSVVDSNGQLRRYWSPCEDEKDVESVAAAPRIGQNGRVLCKVDGCSRERQYRCNGMCKPHYYDSLGIRL